MSPIDELSEEGGNVGPLPSYIYIFTTLFLFFCILISLLCNAIISVVIMLMFANCNGEPVNQTARINSDAHVIDRRPILVPSFSHNVTL